MSEPFSARVGAIAVQVQFAVWLDGDEAGKGRPAGDGDVRFRGINPFEGEFPSVAAAGGDPGDGGAGESAAISLLGPELEVGLGHALVLGRFVLRTGDIAVAMTGATVGKVAEVDRDNLLLNQRVGVVRRKETAEQKFLLHVLRSPDFYNFCQTTVGGGAQGNIAPRQILEYEIPLPPLEEQRRLVAELDAEAAQMDSVRSLLPRFEAKIQRVLDRVWGNNMSDNKVDMNESLIDGTLAQTSHLTKETSQG